MIPVIALIGRPNVGKSTLFNQLTKSREALVADLEGLTRDRKYGEGKVGGRPYILIDTGGITGAEEGIDLPMAQQSMAAAEEADVVLLMLDARAGLTGVDQELVALLRRQSIDFHVVVNKIDGLNVDAALSEFYTLGVDPLFEMAASHNRGVRSMIEKVLEAYPEPALEEPAEEHDQGIKVAIVGRPNVGKSTLVNRLLGEERVVVYDHPGTTRDSVYIDFERGEDHYTLIDTAGVRRRKNVRESVEKFSIVKTLRAIDDANVVLLLMDAHEGIVDQDMHLLGHCIEAGRALVVVINKWDGLDDYQKDRIKTTINRRLKFVDFAQMHFISALHGSGVGLLYASINGAYAAATQKLSTNYLTRILEGALADHPPPMVNGRRIKLRYAHAGGQNPPRIVIHGNQTDKLPNSYERYLENVYRRELGIEGTPIKIELRTSENPYAGRRNKLTQRQINRKRRLMAHVKKKK